MLHSEKQDIPEPPPPAPEPEVPVIEDVLLEMEPLAPLLALHEGVTETAELPKEVVDEGGTQIMCAVTSHLHAFL